MCVCVCLLGIWLEPSSEEIASGGAPFLVYSGSSRWLAEVLEGV